MKKKNSSTRQPTFSFFIPPNAKHILGYIPDRFALYLPKLLESNRDYIIESIRFSKSSLSVKRVIESLTRQRHYISYWAWELHQSSYSDSKKSTLLFNLVGKYTKELLHYIKEQAFQDDFVFSMVALFRRKSFKDRNSIKVVEWLLEPLMGRKIIVEDWAKLKFEEIYARIGKLPTLWRKWIVEITKQIADDRQKIVESEIITPISYKRVFGKAGLKPKEEVILVASYAVPDAVIGKAFGLTDEAIRIRVHRLWKRPEVVKAFREKAMLISSPYAEKAYEKDREGKQKKTYNLENPEDLETHLI